MFDRREIRLDRSAYVSSGSENCFLGQEGSARAEMEIGVLHGLLHTLRLIDVGGMVKIERSKKENESLYCAMPNEPKSAMVQVGGYLSVK